MDYWHKQSADKPLYPDLVWDKPERRDQAGRLLIVGGNLHGFAAVGKAFEIVDKLGAGSIRILLPDSLRSKLKAYWTDAIFSPSTPSGSFALDSKDLILGNSLWADAILFPGDLGRNSETAVVLDQILNSYKQNILITKDALDYYLARPTLLLERPNTTIVASFSQLQKMLSKVGHTTPLTYTMGVVRLVEELHVLTTRYPCSIITTYERKYIVALAGQVSTTDGADEDLWRLKTASKAAVNLLHYPSRTFEALTHSVL
jgi:ADP-dependent NAD(P)H-hydrate dehydratase / NAD(P)H-hydrate epimerase